jgi:hypothetical protein
VAEEKSVEKVDPLPDPSPQQVPAERPRTGKNRTILTAQSTAKHEVFDGPSKPFVC